MKKLLLILAVLLSSSLAFAACDNSATSLGLNWTLVQCNSASSGGSSSAAQPNAYTSNLTAGSIAFVFINQQATTPVLSATDSLSQTWTCLTTTLFGATGYLNFCYVLSTLGGADTVSCNSTVSSTFLGCVIGELRNSGGTSLGIDTSSVTAGTTGTTNFTMTTALTLGATNDVILAGAAVGNGPYTVVGSWTSLNISAAGVTTSAPASSAISNATSGAFNAQIIDQAGADPYVIYGVAFKPPNGLLGAVLGGKMLIGGKSIFGF